MMQNVTCEHFQASDWTTVQVFVCTLNGSRPSCVLESPEGRHEMKALEEL